MGELLVWNRTGWCLAKYTALETEKPVHLSKTRVQDLPLGGGLVTPKFKEGFLRLREPQI